ncbi:LOW QUALITY PROTEIN: hypothetical protein V1478_003804 [Vespula squamosa]|uniref:Uncharacterized protein n=1 Tax=Vespula squamosa TaxID=30214 RepID=A0ABD2BMX0_VESSQ
MQPPTNPPPTISTYLIFNQLRIIHPQFRPKSRSSVLEPSQNFLSNAFSYLELTIVIEYSIVVVRARSKEEAICRRGPHKLWLKRATIRLLSYFRRHDRSCLEMSEADGVDGGAFRKRGLTHLQWAEKPEAPEAERHLESPIARGSPNAATSSRWDLGRKYVLYIKILREARKTLTRVTAGTRVGVSGASLSPTEDCVLIFDISKYRHDRSCLEMSEADGVDGGAFRKRGLTHLQWAEKPEAPEAERHLESPIARGSPNAATSSRWDLGRKYVLYIKILREARKTLTRVTAGTRVGVSGASLSPTEDCVLIFDISKYRHDRSCLEMSEADGVDGGAFRKRGLTHLQWAEKPEAPEAERHLGTRDLEVPDSPWVPECSNLLAVGPGSEILALHENLTGSKHDRSCLEMSEADGVDGGAFRKRGLTHLQWAEKPEAPEAERHLESPIARGSPNAATSSRWDLGRKYVLYIKILREARKTLTRVTAGTRVGVSGASLSPTEDCVLIFDISKYRHDRSCLEMSEADGVDGGAFRKRGLTHLQWAEKPEAPEAERHLGTRDLEVPDSPWVPECSNLLAVGPGSEILALHENLTGSKHDRSCLEMSEADGVDGGAFRKRGLTHLQWAEKPEAPEAERHLGTRDLE